MQQPPTISVVMPVYNGEKYLDEAVESIRRQTFGDFEFIIVNDGSTDGTAEILRRHAATDPRVRVLTQPNQGCAAALNCGCAAARGEFIARMDADDVAQPDRFEKQLGYLREHPQVAVLGGASQFFQDHVLLDAFERPPLQHQAIMEVLYQCNPQVHPSVLIRRAVLEEVGGYRRVFVPAEDLDLWLRLGERFELANLPDIVIHRRKHTEASYYGAAAKQCLAALAAKHSSRTRLRTGVDPCADLAAINPTSLLKAGVPPADIEAVLLTGPPYRVNLLLQRGEFAAAHRLLDDTDRFLLELPGSRRARSRIALLRAKSYGLQHRPARRLLCVVWACLLDPRRTPEHATAFFRR